jgi:PAS domain S-box-containing protein
VPLALFVAVAAIGTANWLRAPRDGMSARFAATFAVLAAIDALVVGAPLVEGTALEAPAQLAVLVLAAAFPFLLLRFTGSFVRLLPWELPLAGIAVAALAVVGLAIDLPASGDSATVASKAYTACFTVVWLTLLSRVMAGFWLAGQHRSHVVRMRMRCLALGVLLIAVALVISVATPDEPQWLTVALAGAVALVTLAGYAPPGWLRTVWRRRDTEALRLATAELMSATDEAEVGEALFPVFPALMGSQVGALVGVDGSVYGNWQMSPDEARELARRVAERGVPSGETLIDGDAMCMVVDDGAVLAVQRERATPLFGDEEEQLLQAVGWMSGSALRRARETRLLHEREAQLRTAQELANVGSWEWDIRTDTVTWSDNLYRIFGVEVGTPIDYASYQQRLHEEERARIGETVREAIATGTDYELDHRVVRPDGKEVFIHSRGMPVRDASGEVVQLFGMVQDVSRQRAAERHLRTALETEREVRRRLQAVDELKDNLLAAVSHELRTPLTSVVGFALTLRDRWDQLDQATVRLSIEHLANESLRLERMLVDLLDIDRLQRGAIEPTLDVVDLDALVRSVWVNLPDSLRDRVSLPPAGTHVEAEVDAAKLERVVENLLVNAARDTPDTAHIWVALAGDDDHALITVSDDGPGIPEEQRAEIFQPFVRGGNGLGHAPGLGIGLALVSQLTRLHGGTVSVGERDGGGAQFEVRLPRRAPRPTADV